MHHNSYNSKGIDKSLSSYISFTLKKIKRNILGFIKEHFHAIAIIYATTSFKLHYTKQTRDIAVGCFINLK